MGYIANDVTVIIATKDDNKWLAKFRDGLNEDFMPLLVGPIDHAVNGLYTWVLTPNGSKDRWDTKRTGQRVQDRLEARCRKHNTDYVTVRFGGDYRYEIGATITGGSHLTSHTN